MGADKGERRGMPDASSRNCPNCGILALPNREHCSDYQQEIGMSDENKSEPESTPSLLTRARERSDAIGEVERKLAEMQRDFAEGRDLVEGPRGKAGKVAYEAYRTAMNAAYPEEAWAVPYTDLPADERKAWERAIAEACRASASAKPDGVDCQHGRMTDAGEHCADCRTREAPSEDVARMVHAFGDADRKQAVRDLAGRVCATEDALRAHEADLAAAAGECLVPIPSPGSDLAKMLRANVLLRRENEAQRHGSAKTPDGRTWAERLVESQERGARAAIRVRELEAAIGHCMQVAKDDDDLGLDCFAALQAVMHDGIPERRSSAAMPGVSCPDGTGPDEPSDRGGVCCHEVEADEQTNNATGSPRVLPRKGTDAEEAARLAPGADSGNAPKGGT